MRKFLQKSGLLLIAIFSLGLTSLLAQVPQAINFQAIARDGDSNPMVNTNIQIRLSVVDETPEGTVVYQELRALQTNAYGSFSFQIGVGANFVTIGTMQEIEWENGSKFLKIDYDPTNTFTFNLTLGTIEFVSVPYAFAAETVVFIDATGAVDGDVLVYNEVTGKFEPGTVTAGSVTWENVQGKPDFAEVATSGDYDDLINIPIIPTVPENVSEFNNDAGYLTEVSIIAGSNVSVTGSGTTADPYIVTATGGGASLLPPTVSVVAASDVQIITAQMNGVVNPNSLSTTVVFEYGLTSSYGSTANAVQNPVTGIANANVSKPLTGLVGNTTYHYRVKATNAVDISYSNDMSFTTLLSSPQLTTTAISSILAFTATSGGNVTYDGGSPVTARGVCWSTSPNPTTANNSVASGSGNGSFVSNLTGLTQATTYYVRAYATNAVGTTYGNEISFTTQSGVVSLTTTAISNTLAFSASSGGNITNDGGTPVTTRGVCWSTSSNPTTANTYVASGSGTGLFTINLTSLTHNTTYYVRAYATNAVGTTYGNEISFTTQSGVVSLSTTAISSITVIAAVSGGNITTDGGSSVTAKGVCWSTTTGPTIANSITNDGSGNGVFTSNLTGLALGTTYYVRAYATNAVGTTYGNERSFTTIALPTIATAEANDIKGNSAKAGGAITNDGGSTVTAQGLCWSTTANPTTANNITTPFTEVMTGLSPNTTYYVRAYATNIAGTGYGNEISFNSGRLIGSSYAGGLVFYNDGAGHGLVCAESDQGAAPWGCNGTLIGGTSTTLGTGLENTIAIVNGCAESVIPARLCYDLVLNGYDDWYLPSIDELVILLLNQSVIGGFSNNYYFSSSEVDATIVWKSHTPNNIGGATAYKTDGYRFRAIRSF